MESLLGLAAAHWDHEPVWIVRSVRSPAFRRPGPAKAGTPNVRSMESPLSIFRMHWDHEPKMRNLFICKGSILRFMERVNAPRLANPPIADATLLLRLSCPL